MIAYKGNTLISFAKSGDLIMAMTGTEVLNDSSPTGTGLAYASPVSRTLPVLPLVPNGAHSPRGMDERMGHFVLLSVLAARGEGWWILEETGHAAPQLPSGSVW